MPKWRERLERPTRSRKRNTQEAVTSLSEYEHKDLTGAVEEELLILSSLPSRSRHGSPGDGSADSLGSEVRGEGGADLAGSEGRGQEGANGARTDVRGACDAQADRHSRNNPEKDPENDADSDDNGADTGAEEYRRWSAVEAERALSEMLDAEASQRMVEQAQKNLRNARKIRTDAKLRERAAKFKGSLLRQVQALSATAPQVLKRPNGRVIRRDEYRAMLHVYHVVKAENMV